MSDRLAAWLAEVVRSRKILVVEDDSGTQMLLKEFMCRFNCEVIQAFSGREALSYLSNPQVEIDFVILDLIMPGGMSGQDLFKNIRSPEIRAIRSRLPVAILSGYISADVMLDMKKTGFCCFIQKPDGLTLPYVADMLYMFGIIEKIPNGIENCHPSCVPSI